MAVLLNKRNISSLEFFNTAMNLRVGITKLLLKDFGIRDKIRKVKTDKQEYTIIEEYPAWIVIEIRKDINKTMRKMMKNIISANTIYPKNKKELLRRTNKQNKAIEKCQHLLQEITFATEIFPLNIEKLLPYVKMIEKEIVLLKGWRKYNNFIAKKLDIKLGVDFEQKHDKFR
jgi:hypothetical protein